VQFCNISFPVFRKNCFSKMLFHSKWWLVLVSWTHSWNTWANLVLVKLNHLS